jgi:NAD(P)-dependent dehydrogenase (short-subunit alcohol dehydrogenase family)
MTRQDQMAEQDRCIIVGGSGALGAAVARALAAEGARIGLTYFSGDEAVSRLSDELPGLLAVRADLREIPSLEQAIGELAERLGGVTALVHSAAICLTPGDPVPPDKAQKFEHVHAAGWDELMSINVRSAYFACRQAVPHLRRSGGGNVVLVGSISGTRPLPSPVHYATSKTALQGMARAMAKEVGRDNICVNVIEPGILEAGVSRTLPPPLLEDYQKHCALKRVGRMEEVANVVVWFARHNTYVTGQNILVDGAL